MPSRLLQAATPSDGGKAAAETTLREREDQLASLTSTKNKLDEDLEKSHTALSDLTGANKSVNDELEGAKTRIGDLEGQKSKLEEQTRRNQKPAWPSLA